MKERPILFSAPMVKAILENRKTMTRRICKNQPEPSCWGMCAGYKLYQCLKQVVDGLYWRYQHTITGAGSQDAVWVKCPYGQVGDRLWVRETWATNVCYDSKPPRETANHGLPFWYLADDSVIYTGATTGGPAFMEKGKTRVSIHMPRWASRITLEITGIRIERLNDISEEDAKAEGAQPSIVGSDLDHLRYRAGFQSLWESINGSWSANPWVWVIKFKRVTQ